jgi:hypothetical protein
VYGLLTIKRVSLTKKQTSAYLDSAWLVHFHGVGY